MTTKLFKDLKQHLAELGYHHNGDKWGATMGLFFDLAAKLFEEDYCPREWQYRPGAGGNQQDEESYSYEFLSELNTEQAREIGDFLHRLTNRLEKAGLSY